MTKYGIWNSVNKRFEFDIAEDTAEKAAKAHNKLARKLGYDSRYAIKPIPQKKMRKNLFRGLGICGEGWIYGNLIQNNDGRAFIAEKVENSDLIYCVACGAIYENVHEVDISTVGQATGLKGANGSNIFEGDILELHLDDGSTRRFEATIKTIVRELKPLDGFYAEKNYVEITGVIFVMRHDGKEFDLLPSFVDNQSDVRKMIILGNIHENEVWDEKI